MSKEVNPPKWHEVYRGDEEKCVFVGKDGASGLIRAKDKEGKRFDWRSTDALARESGLSKKRTEEILDHWCKKGVVRQHVKDPEKWGYWEVVGKMKEDPDVVKEDHKDRVDRILVNSGLKKASFPSSPSGPPSSYPLKKSPGSSKSLPNAAPAVPATPAKVGFVSPILPSGRWREILNEAQARLIEDAEVTYRLARDSRI